MVFLRPRVDRKISGKAPLSWTVGRLDEVRRIPVDAEESTSSRYASAQNGSRQSHRSPKTPTTWTNTMVSVDPPAPSTAVAAKNWCSSFDASACCRDTAVAHCGGGSTVSTEREPSTISLQILRLPQVCNVTGLRRSMIYQLEAEQRFPKRIKIGIRAVGWIESEVQIWVAKRIAASRTPVKISA